MAWRSIATQSRSVEEAAVKRGEKAFSETGAAGW
jgi:hypothetical protein